MSAAVKPADNRNNAGQQRQAFAQFAGAYTSTESSRACASLSRDFAEPDS